MQPKVTIILPVYNVEPYLRQCLDSVVNQPMQDIQIICVNDGSTDNSRLILQEYADKDSRIEIIDQENQGGGTARNAAYPHIRGKYTYFADPDDWLELDLCQQCYDKAEATGADLVVLRYFTYNPDQKCSPCFDPLLPKIRQSPEEKCETFCGCQVAPWQRFWQTNFLLSNNIHFSDGKRPYNDTLHSWKGTVLANRVAVLDNPLYHYRTRLDSYQRTNGEKCFVIVETYCEIWKMLQNTGFYADYRVEFISQKMRICMGYYFHVPTSLRPRFAAKIRDSLTEDDRAFYRSAPKKVLGKLTRLFYEMIDGGQLETANYHVSYLFVQKILPIVRMPERLLRKYIIKPLKKRLKAA
jgi:glycosyltransferase involved in cell wall biosynthesis